MEQTNGNGDFGYQFEVEVSSNSVDARGNFPKKSIHVVKERDKPPYNEKPDVDEEDDFLEADDYDLNEEEIEDEIDDEEVEEEEDDEESIEEFKIAPEFSLGAFLVLKTDLRRSVDEPPIWRIDGKALVKKYVPFKLDGRTLYRSTSAYSGWTKDSKKYYYPATVVTLSETQKEHVVDFKKDLIPKEEPDVNDEADFSEGQIDDDRESLDDGEVLNDQDVDEDEKVENSEKNENFTSGSFLVVKLDALEKRPPAIWKIDYKALLQKYVPCEGGDGQMLYKSTNSFDGWSIKMKNSYYPAVVMSLEESGRSHVVELKNVIRT